MSENACEECKLLRRHLTECDKAKLAESIRIAELEEEVRGLRAVVAIAKGLPEGNPAYAMWPVDQSVLTAWWAALSALPKEPKP
jgi:hypothetical protein